MRNKCIPSIHKTNYYKLKLFRKSKHPYIGSEKTVFERNSIILLNADFQKMVQLVIDTLLNPKNIITAEKNKVVLIDELSKPKIKIIQYSVKIVIIKKLNFNY